VFAAVDRTRAKRSVTRSRSTSRFVFLPDRTISVIRIGLCETLILN
jgi:hypothetical protein